MFLFLYLLTIILLGINCELCVLEPLATRYHPTCNFSRQFVSFGSQSLNHLISSRDDYAEFIRECDKSSKYRRYDGYCNNLINHSWGASYTSLLRLLPPNYNGGDSPISTGKKLPEARFISTSIFIDKNNESRRYSLLDMQWGQLLSHDMSLAPGSTKNPINCCLLNSKHCFPINIPSNDEFFKQHNQTCMNMLRTKTIDAEYGNTIVPQQVSSVSHTLDLSQMYGSSKSAVSEIRTFQSGLLKAYTVNGREYLPLSPDSKYDCNSNELCFRSGDARVNQHAQLTCLQILLFREHNRIARSLAQINPHWNDEKLFEETRRLVIAIYQHITYKEWLPVVIESNIMKQFHLNSLSTGFTSYNSSINPSTMNSFTTAAFRVLHSSIQPKIFLMNQQQEVVEVMNITDTMNRPSIVLKDENFDGFLLGLAWQGVQIIDKYFTKQLTEMMFHGGHPFGEDIVSYDIQRGRDHGLPFYNDIRELCNRKRAVKFSDLLEDMDIQNINDLMKVYENVDDVDFYAGGLLERQLPGSDLGATLQCIFAEQFVRKKFGDRFWYEVGNQPHSFTQEQLREIRKTTFSRLLCDNGDNITKIQPNSFYTPAEKGNGVVSCSEIPSLNIAIWIE